MIAGVGFLTGEKTVYFTIDKAPQPITLGSDASEKTYYVGSNRKIVTGIQKGRYIYCRVRAYKSIANSSKRYYSAWSNVLKVKVQ